SLRNQEMLSKPGLTTRRRTKNGGHGSRHAPSALGGCPLEPPFVSDALPLAKARSESPSESSAIWSLGHASLTARSSLLCRQNRYCARPSSSIAASRYPASAACVFAITAPAFW